MLRIFYHSADLDGICSGAITYQFLKRKEADYDGVELCPIDYGDGFPWHEISPEDFIVMVDFSLQPFDQMLKLNDFVNNNFIWIDHHSSAIKESIGKKLIGGLQKEGKAGCELCWEFFHQQASIPEVVTLLGRYDVWDEKHPDWKNKILPFQYGMKAMGLDADHWLWELYLDAGNESNSMAITAKIMQGEAILRYLEQAGKKTVESCAYEQKFKNFNCIILNKFPASSKSFESVWDPEKYHMMIAFGWKKHQWTVSLYTTREDVDCGAIAKKYGGGGHKQAAGFQCDQLPFFPFLGRGI